MCSQWYHMDSDSGFHADVTSQNGGFSPESNLRLVYSVCELTLSFMLYCCSHVFVLLDLCKPLPFYIHSHCFSGIFFTIIVFSFLAYSIVRRLLKIIMFKLLLTLCKYDCVICIYDGCDIVSIDVYSLSIPRCFTDQVFRVNVEQTPWQYTTLSNASFYSNFFRCFIFISHYGFLLEVKTFDYVYFISLVFRLSIVFRKAWHA